MLVIGDQGSGKSSVIEHIIGINFLPKENVIIYHMKDSLRYFPVEVSLCHDPNVSSAFAEIIEVKK